MIYQCFWTNAESCFLSHLTASVESSVAGFSGLVKPSEIFPSCHERPLGLRNLGNTCYMNAVIQSLSHTRALVTFFLRCLHKELTNFSNPLGYGGAVSAQFQRLFTAVWSAADCTPELTQFKVSRPVSLLGRLSKFFLLTLCLTPLWPRSSSYVSEHELLDIPISKVCNY